MILGLFSKMLEVSSLEWHVGKYSDCTIPPLFWRD